MPQMRCDDKAARQSSRPRTLLFATRAHRLPTEEISQIHQKLVDHMQLVQGCFTLARAMLDVVLRSYARRCAPWPCGPVRVIFELDAVVGEDRDDFCRVTAAMRWRRNSAAIILVGSLVQLRHRRTCWFDR